MTQRDLKMGSKKIFSSNRIMFEDLRAYLSVITKQLYQNPKNKKTFQLFFFIFKKCGIKLITFAKIILQSKV